ncbi:protein of unknown function [Tenacibaculum sp. MAR_2010_89]|uniref:DUF4296 domain-containing protein n=1 Tax=Tenacibaculum sp. MAR_2010_89 TaxID=1250198 RepID=UPI00089A36D3|nr:DUF4296 domain-containing protein [Tenacibaculum sp. MAR_2010_89]SED94422.1 protein of unknown function [Tenacibaculum sp. MAR_2010_89]
MNKFLYFFILMFLVSCTSNTIYKKPKDLIPKDSMVNLLTDMYLASSAKNIKNKNLKKLSNYMVVVYEKYKIDTVRFDTSNKYYTSRIDEYSEMLNLVKKNIDSLYDIYITKQRIQDSLDRPNILNLTGTETEKQIDKKLLLKGKELPEKLEELDKGNHR